MPRHPPRQTCRTTIAKAALLARFEKEYLADLLRRSGENISQAARIAGVERNTSYSLLEKTGLCSPCGGATG